MNADRKGVGIRVGLEGGEVVKRGFNEIADSGRKMFAELAVGSKVAAPGIESVNAGAKGLQAGMGLATVASTGAAVALAAVTTAVLQTRAAMAMGDEIADTASQLQISTSSLQEFRFAMVEAGGSVGDADAAIGDFTKKLGEARAGSKEASEWFRRLGFSAEEVDNFASIEAAITAVSQRIGELSDTAERAAVAEKLGLGKFIPVINEGAGAIERFRQKARDAGVVLSDDVIEKLSQAQTKSEALSYVLDAQLAVAFSDLGPILTGVTEKLVGFVSEINKLIAKTGELQAKARGNFYRQPQWAQDAVLAAARSGKMSREVFKQQFGIDPDTGMPLQEVLEGSQFESPDRSFRVERPPASLLPPAASRNSPRRAAAAGRKGLTEEEKAAGLAALKLEQDLAVARAEGNEVLIERLQTLKFINEQAEKYVKLGMSEADARAQADYDAMRREAAAERKRQEDLFGKSVVDVGSSPNVDSQAPDLVIGPDGKAWTPEQKAAWARSVGDATADGLDYALNGGDLGDWILQLFYRNALQGVSNAMAEGLNNADFSAMGGDANGNWLLSAVQWTGSIFAGQPQGRAAGGPMGQGYNFGEHGRPELGMFSNGFVADHDTTQRMLVDAVAQANQASGARGGGGAQRIEMHVSTDLKIPPGYIPDAGMRALLAQHQQQTVALIAEKIGPMARTQQSQAYELKE